MTNSEEIPQSRIWAMNIDAKSSEYIVQLNSTVINFKRVSIAILSFLFVLLFLFILPSASDKSVKQLNKFLEEIVGTEEKRDRKEEAVNIRAAMKWYRKTGQVVKLCYGQSEDHNHEQETRTLFQ